MKKVLTCLLLFVAINASAQFPTGSFNTDIIPKPAEMKVASGYVTLDKTSPLYLDSKFSSVAQYFQDELKAATNITFELSKKQPKNTEGAILVAYDGSLGAEAYEMTVGDKNIKISASDNGGVVYALQSLRQLVRQNNHLWAHQYIFVPQLTISDKPTYGWRGYMLDVSRSFFSINQIKEMIDYMAQIKLNRLQLHLSDDQGFRVEMIKYPKLNTVGSWRVDHTNFDENDNSVWGRPVQKEGELANYGGYYTREELKDLVAYAKVRNIEILPEIDVPGHSQAIIAAYPEVSCEPNKKFYVATGAVMGNNTVCPSTEASYELIDAVISEVAEIFPFEYIHIGGDECSKTQWAAHDQCTHFKEDHGLKDDKELQSYFIKRVEKIVNSKGKKLIGWDEILEGGLAPNATVMSWRGTAGGVKSAKMGHNVIMSPVKSNYLDLKQGQALSEPNLGYKQALLSSAYNFVIAHEELTEEEHKFILGTQANLWTETNSDLSKVKYMTFPRLMAVAENAWTPDSEKSWDDFTERLKSYMNIMDFDGVRHAKSVFNPWVHHKGDGKEIKLWFSSEITNPEIRYTLDGTDPKETSCLYTNGDTLILTQTAILKVAMFDDGKILGNVVTRNYPIHKAAGAKVIIRSKGNVDGVEDVNSALVDLSYGEFLEDNDPNWKQFDEDADIEIFFAEPTDIEKLRINTVRHTLWRWYAAKQIEVFTTIDGKCAKIGDTGVMEKNLEKGRNIIENVIVCPAKDVNSIRIKITRLPNIPMDYVPSVAGKNTLLNIDEIVVY